MEPGLRRRGKLSSSVCIPFLVLQGTAQLQKDILDTSNPHLKPGVIAFTVLGVTSPLWVLGRVQRAESCNCKSRGYFPNEVCTVSFLAAQKTDNWHPIPHHTAGVCWEWRGDVLTFKFYSH